MILLSETKFRQISILKYFIWLSKGTVLSCYCYYLTLFFFFNYNLFISAFSLLLSNFRFFLLLFYFNFRFCYLFISILLLLSFGITFVQVYSILVQSRWQGYIGSKWYPKLQEDTSPT